MLRFLTPRSVALSTPGAGRNLSVRARRARARRDFDAVLSMIAAAPQEDFLEGRCLDLNALLDAPPRGADAPRWFVRRRLGSKLDGEVFARWLERTASEAAARDVRYVSGPAHVVSALLHIVARARAAANEAPCWSRLAAIQTSDCDGARYAPLLLMHATHPVHIVEALRVPRLGTVAVAMPNGELLLLLDRGLAFELASADRAAARVPLWESEPGADYELVVSSPADGLFEVSTGAVLRCASRSPLKFLRLAASRGSGALHVK